jgi:hypothetical protein
VLGSGSSDNVTSFQLYNSTLSSHIYIGAMLQISQVSHHSPLNILWSSFRGRRRVLIFFPFSRTRCDTLNCHIEEIIK